MMEKVFLVILVVEVFDVWVVSTVWEGKWWIGWILGQIRVVAACDLCG